MTTCEKAAFCGENPVAVALEGYRTAMPPMQHVAAYDPTVEGWEHIRAITYDGASVGDKKTKVFAFVGFPDGACAAHKVPAVVLVHGGGGHAFAQWVKMWNDRGYGAIAMDTTGFFPSEAGRGLAGWDGEDPARWHYGLYGPFAEEGYVNAPNNDDVSTSAQPLDKQWLYHAVVSVLAAHNILKADSRVDAGKIGITGISWGGDITSVAIGYDPDFAFAVPVYGSGYLGESLGYQGPIFSEPYTKALWSPEARFSHVTYPVMWLGWSSDIPFSINSQSRSYLDTKSAGGVLNMKVNWGHSHGGGWEPEDTFIFADAAVGRLEKLTAITAEPVAEKQPDGTWRVTAAMSPDITATGLTVTAAYLTAPLSYSVKDGGHEPTIDQTWRTVGGRVEADGKTVTASLPPEAKDFYLVVSTETAKDKYDVSTCFVQGLA